jgi:membrane protein YdbS with pleckstrin-like domain
MHLPANVNDLLRFVIALTTVVGAIVIQYYNKEIPAWLTIGVSAIVAYYFGLVSNSRKVE